MQPIPYLTFQDGKCAEAMNAYARIFGTDAPAIDLLSTAPMADQFPAEKHGWAMNAMIRIGDGWLFGSDDISGGSPAMAGSSVMITLDDNAAAQAAFEALSEGGDVRMAYEKTFWAEGFGEVTDRWGIRWMISGPMVGM